MLLEAIYIVTPDENILQWFDIVGSLSQSIIEVAPALQLSIFWIHEQYLPQHILQKCLDILRSFLPTEWVLCFSLCKASHFGDPIDTCRYVVSISTSTHNLEYINQVSPTGYGVCISKISFDSFVIESSSHCCHYSPVQ